MKVSFSEEAFADYQEWSLDKKTFAKINELIKNICRTPFSGIGKPEPLKHKLSNYWSRRISQEHRIVYKVSDDEIFIASCKFHY